MPRLLDYWRNCLADTVRKNIDPKRLHDAYETSKDKVEVGAIDSVQADKIVTAYWKEIGVGNMKNKQGEPLKPEEVELPAKVLLCPIVVMPRMTHAAREAGREMPLTPLWIPAQLSRSGALHPAEQDVSWIPRNLLEPLFQAGDSIGEVEAVDTFLTLNPSPVNDEDPEQPPRWTDVCGYANRMLEAVSGQTLTDFQLEDYEMKPQSYLLLDTEPRVPARHVIKLYDHLRRNFKVNNSYSPPSLLNRYASLTDEALVPLLTSTQHLKQSASHGGQMSWQHALSVSQREAMHHILTLQDGEMLAINGPPGTGKTTLLQSVVATLWVEAARRGKRQPPIIVAASTNNQAVTNVIDSFGKVAEDDSPLGGRWLPGLTSYGLYCPSSSKQRDAAKFQITMPAKDGGFYLAQTSEQANAQVQRRNIEDETYVREAEQFFLARCREYAVREINDVETATNLLHEKLIETTRAIEQGLEAWSQWENVSKEIASIYGANGGIKMRLDELRSNLEEARHDVRAVETAKHSWLEYANTTPFWMTLLWFLPPVKERVRVHHKLFFSKINFDVQADLSNAQQVLEYLEDATRKRQEKEQSIYGELTKVEEDWRRLGTARSVWTSWCNYYEISDQPPRLLDTLDTRLRYIAFRLATHYWEGCWLLEMKEQFESRYEEKQSEIKQQKRWRRYAKLAPCNVATLYMLPAFFTSYNHKWQTSLNDSRDLPLYEFIDLLILDEAGQVAPDVAGATFALAKKALIVGDTWQIEPVWGNTKQVDVGNLKKYEVAITKTEADTIFDAGLSASTGNVMKVAQRASKYQKHDERGAFERGMFLAEHRRCVPEIIAYCNELAYKNRLIPKRESITDYPLPHLGYAHIPGESSKSGGSRGNQTEAQVIACWIAEYRQRLEAIYPQLPLSEILAVVTPFRKQTKLLEKELAAHGVKDKIKVGTVHILQGAERFIVIFSSVYAAIDSPPYFFDMGVNMLNVAVSRAKDSFLVFGDMNVFNSRNTHAPSGLLARYLFADEANEITNLKLPMRQNLTLSRSHPHLDTLALHRAALIEGISKAWRSVHIISPFIAEAAILADDLPTIIKQAVQRGVAITIYTDPQLNLDKQKNEKASFIRGKRLLRESGAQVKQVYADHSKILIVDDSLLIEGSFNWLSASRDAASAFQRQERSMRYEGKDVATVIAKIINETESRVMTAS